MRDLTPSCLLTGCCGEKLDVGVRKCQEKEESLSGLARYVFQSQVIDEIIQTQLQLVVFITRI